MERVHCCLCNGEAYVFYYIAYHGPVAQLEVYIKCKQCGHGYRITEDVVSIKTREDLLRILKATETTWLIANTYADDVKVDQLLASPKMFCTVKHEDVVKYMSGEQIRFPTYVRRVDLGVCSDVYFEGLCQSPAYKDILDRILNRNKPELTNEEAPIDV